MKLPNLDEARKRTKNEIEFVTLNQNYDANTFKNQKYFCYNDVTFSVGSHSRVEFDDDSSKIPKWWGI